MKDEGLELIFPLGSKTQQALREAADQVQFSRYIGDKWEEVSVGSLRKLQEDRQKARKRLGLEKGKIIGDVVLLDTDPEISREAEKSKIPDAVLLELSSINASYVTLRACDFKFNLNRALYSQVHPMTLFELLEKSKKARIAVRRAISRLSAKGLLQRNIELPDKFHKDQSHLDYVVLDRQARIRLDTGRFISPDTRENREYFRVVEMRGLGIGRENVYVLTLSREEIDEFLKDAPGKRSLGPAKNIKLDESLLLFDRKLIRARAAAAMEAYGLTEVSDLPKLLQSRRAYLPVSKFRKLRSRIIRTLKRQKNSAD